MLTIKTLLPRKPKAIACTAVAWTLALCGCASTAPNTRAEQAAPPAADLQTQKPANATPASPTSSAPGETAKPAPAKALIATSPDGTKIAYEKTGTGPALLLLHGNGQTRTSWTERGYVEKLKDRYTVIAMDRRGNGDSGKPTTADAYALDTVLADVIAVADAAGAKQFHLWGFGQGGTVARYLAARSDRVLSAVLVATPMGPAVTGMVGDAITGMRAKWQPLVDAQRAGTLDLKTMSPGDRTAWDAGIGQAAMALGALLDYPPLEPAEIKTRTLWLVGSADAGAQENIKDYEGKLSSTKVTLKQISGASYSDSFAKPAPVLAEVEPFLAGKG